MYNKKYRSLKPHRYPIWITASFLLCMALFIYSLRDVKYYLHIKETIAQADLDFLNDNYLEAANKYVELSSLFPDERRYSLQAAKSLFKTDDKSNQKRAAQILDDIDVTGEEIDDIINYIPLRYLNYFKNRE